MMSKELKQDMVRVSDFISKCDLADSTIMVTGATGLIGSLIIKSMLYYNSVSKNRIKIVALARNPDKVKTIYSDDIVNCDSQITFVYQDICQPISDSVACDYIIHTANSTTSKYFLTNPVEVIDSIYLGTKNILEYARGQQVKGLVYLSSMEVFGQIYSEDRVSEQQLGYLDIQNVRSCYSEGKRIAELLCNCYAKEYDVPVKVARLAQTFGAGVLPGENRVFAQFARSAVKGEDIILHTKGESVGNYCYTTDVLRAVFLLLTKGDKGESYTVVNEATTMTIAEMAHLVATHFSDGKSKVVFDIPEGNAYGYAPDTKMRLSSKKLETLGWQPEIDLVEAYRRMMPDLN